MSEHEKRFFKWAFGLSLFVCVFFIGCANKPKEPEVQPSVQDVRGDSDRFFKKMEQEEKVPAAP